MERERPSPAAYLDGSRVSSKEAGGAARSATKRPQVGEGILRILYWIGLQCKGLLRDSNGSGTGGLGMIILSSFLGWSGLDDNFAIALALALPCLASPRLASPLPCCGSWLALSPWPITAHGSSSPAEAAKEPPSPCPSKFRRSFFQRAAWWSWGGRNILLRTLYF